MLIEILKHALMISSFVFTMMLVIEYLNVQTRGQWQEILRNKPLFQYILSAFFGATPGCLGAFTVVSLYTHRVVSFGALVAAMIATSGDEAYLMFSMFPLKALILTVLLFFTGIIAGFFTDLIYKKQSRLVKVLNYELPIHDEERCNCFQKALIVEQLRNVTFTRALLVGFSLLFLFSLLNGSIGPQQWDWVRVTLLISALFTLFVVLTAPEHFLEEHIWEHLIKKHLLQIFLWTFGALLIIHQLEVYLDVENWIASNYLLVLLVAVLVGIIPESGPHMIFVTLFAEGALPFSILMASSIVQDGHGMLPLLATSRKGFVITKSINVLVGLIIGLIAWIAHLY